MICGRIGIEYEIYHITGWGYYGGRSEKYYDMYNIVLKKYAKCYNLEEAERLRQYLQKVNDTKVVIEEYGEEEN